MLSSSNIFILIGFKTNNKFNLKRAFLWTLNFFIRNSSSCFGVTPLIFSSLTIFCGFSTSIQCGISGKQAKVIIFHIDTCISDAWRRQWLSGKWDWVVGDGGACFCTRNCSEVILFTFYFAVIVCICSWQNCPPMDKENTQLPGPRAALRNVRVASSDLCPPPKTYTHPSIHTPTK